MEQENPSDAVIQVPNGHTITELPRDVETKSTSILPRTRRKRRSAMQIFKVALFMMRNRSQKPKPFPVNDGSRSLWNKLIGSMRPLQLQPRNDSSSPSPSPSSSPSLQVKCKAESLDHSSPSHDTDFSDDTLFSPSAASCASASDSRYASAVGLNEMVMQTEEEEEESKSADEGEGDNMIDAKAEEFIANFYQQMRLQRMNSMDYYREIRERSLG